MNTCVEVCDRSASKRNRENSLLCFFDTFLDSSRNFFCFSVAKANVTVSITDDYKSCKCETSSTFNYLCNTVDRDDALFETRFPWTFESVVASDVRLFWRRLFAVAVVICVCHNHPIFLKLNASFARSICDIAATRP
jgi:hypothetical protein